MGDEGHALANATQARFRAAVANSGHVWDDPQLTAIDALSAPTRHGYYLWGGVGRGKSLLGDTYFAAIPTARKRRFHFHDFFRDLHTQIVRDRVPLDRSLRGLIGNADVVLFDEFHVHDVADGVYLTATLRRLLDAGTLIVATSNYAPEALMPNPLHHERFRPAIELIRERLDVVHLRDGRDYRTERAGDGRGFATGTWSTRPSAPPPPGPAVDLDAAGHMLSAQHVDDGGGTFTFRELCSRALGVAQYLWLAEHLRTITLTAVPDLATVDRDPLARFANLIDVLHDRDIPLHVTAVGEPGRLREATEPPRDVDRIVSRLFMLRRA
ncbi:cell division protein ZapE [Microbacterium sp. X-17]|uniref:cell division protein ZapE n=1 Tax=Microbacterium sp. X-17 TaxID=3144404 RepID=UPI0031F4E4EA